MKILHIGKYFHPFKGGIEYVTQSLAEFLSNTEHHVRVLVHAHSEQAAKTPPDFGYVLTRVPIVGTILFTPMAPLFIFYLWRELRHNPDIIHIHMPNPSAFWLLLLPRSRRAKWLVHWHSDVIDEQASFALKLFYLLYRPFERWLLHKTDVIVCTSPAYARSSKALRHVQHKVRVVPLGINLTKPEPQVDEASSAHTKRIPMLLTVGRLTYYKGHAYLLHALKQLKQQRKEFLLDIVGSGEEEAGLRRLTQTLQLSDNVNFLGRLSDESLHQKFTECDIFCLPSIERTEAFGIVLLEAMRASKPCIVTDVRGSGMNFVVNHEITGLVVKRANASTLAEALNRLITDPEFARQLGIAGRRRLEQHFDACKVNEQMLEIYHSLR